MIDWAAAEAIHVSNWPWEALVQVRQQTGSYQPGQPPAHTWHAQRHVLVTHRSRGKLSRRASCALGSQSGSTFRSERTEAIGGAIELASEVFEVVGGGVDIVRKLDALRNHRPHEPHREAHEQVRNGRPQVAVHDGLALIRVELVVLDVPFLEGHTPIERRREHTDRLRVLDLVIGGILAVLCAQRDPQRIERGVKVEESRARGVLRLAESPVVIVTSALCVGVSAMAASDRYGAATMGMSERKAALRAESRRQGSRLS